MNIVDVRLGERSYQIVIGSRLIDRVGSYLRNIQLKSKIVIISNPTVFNLYGQRLLKSLQDEGLDVHLILIPDGESYKDYFWSYHILSELLKLRLDRRSCLIAFGGGVIGDITGFCAALYMRGIRFIQVPTTLLAQVDSAVGGKTGVNHPLGKNMIGAFYQPSLVLADIDTLNTLPKREFLCGIAEVVKYGVIRDYDFFEYIYSNVSKIQSLNTVSITTIIKRSCEIKADVVGKDERENDLRAILNFGHTIGHAIETEGGYSRFLHGEAVAIGMSVASQIAVKAGILQKAEADRIIELCNAFGFNLIIPNDIAIEALLKHMMIDKKAEGGKIRLVLPQTIGKAIIRDDISIDLILETIRHNKIS